MNKIKNIKELAKLINAYKNKNMNVVMCHGAFDVLHYGHIAHFNEAKKNGDILIISVTSDEFINKGPNRPFFNQDIRMETLASLEIVDFVVLSNSDVAISNLKTLKPNIYCKGPDYKNNSEDISGNIKREIKAINDVGGKIVYTKSKTFSSSKLINIFSENFTEEQKNFLNLIKSKHSNYFIKKQIDKLSKLNVLCIGETIIDEYVFCKAVGKSGKEPVLVMQELNSEKYLGGVASVANNISDFVKNVSILSIIGDQNSEINFIKSKLNSKIKFDFIKKNNSPTIIKKRFVDHIDKKKLLGVYQINDENLNQKNDLLLQAKLKKYYKKNDTFVVVDYGHGMLNEESTKIISGFKKFTSINAQINSFNFGSQKIDKYKKSDLLIINESELRHDLRDNKSKLEDLIIIANKKIKIKTIVITCGSKGAYLFSFKKDNSFTKVYCPAFASRIVDKIGSGDAMLSVISICISLGFSNELSLFLGSIAAAKSVENIGNSYNLKKIDLLKAVNHMLK